MMAAAMAGCRQEASTASAAPRPPAVESFDEIVQIVTRALDTGSGEIPGGFVASDAGGRSAFTVSNRVTSNLYPPEAQDENYRGTITVSTRTMYSIRRSDDSEGDTSSQSSEEESFSLLDDPDSSDMTFGSDDDGLVTATPADSKSTAPAAENVTSRMDEDVRTFEMEYLNGRWVLKTQPDPETERSIQKAFDYALGLQR